MTQLDKALESASPVAKVAGLWLSTQTGIPSIGPVHGIQLTNIRLAAGKLLLEEPNAVVRMDVTAFLRALELVIQVEAVHQGAIIGMFERWVEAQDGG